MPQPVGRKRTIHSLLPSVGHALFPPAARARARGWAATVGLVAVLVWASPLSPTALGLADAALGLGSPDAAVLWYDQVASFNPMLRDEALYRGAMVYAVDLQDPTRARHRLETLRADLTPGARLAEVDEQIGRLWGEGEHRPRAAAEAYLRAYEDAPGDERAADRLIAAARARAEAGDAEAAGALWDHVAASFPDRRAMALAAHAEALLGAGDAEAALALYQQAEPVARGTDVEPVVKLGLATCLERLGDLDGAIAGFDGADLPDEVQKQRQEYLEARKANLR